MWATHLLTIVRGEGNKPMRVLSVLAFAGITRFEGVDTPSKFLTNRELRVNIPCVSSQAFRDIHALTKAKRVSGFARPNKKGDANHATRGADRRHGLQ